MSNLQEDKYYIIKLAHTSDSLFSNQIDDNDYTDEIQSKRSKSLCNLINNLSINGCIYTNIKVNDKVVQCSKTLTNIINDFNIEYGEEIPIPNIEPYIFEMVVTFCEIHWNDEELMNNVYQQLNETGNVIHKFNRYDNLIKYPDEIIEFDKQFLKDVNIDDICKLISASSFLDIQSLYDFSCKHIANLVKGKNVYEMVDIIGVKNKDNYFTEEEKKEIEIETNCMSNYFV